MHSLQTSFFCYFLAVSLVGLGWVGLGWVASFSASLVDVDVGGKLTQR